MNILLLAIVLLGLAIVLLRKPHDFLSPESLTIIGWSCVLILQIILGSLSYQPSDEFYMSLFVWLAVVLVICFVLRGKRGTVQRASVNANNGVLTAMFWLSVALAPLYVVALFQGAPTDLVMLANWLRHNAQTAVEDLGTLAYLKVLVRCCLILELCRRGSLRVGRIAWLLMMNIAFGLGIMAKGELLSLGVALVAIAYFRNRLKPRVVALASPVVLVGAYLLNVLRYNPEAEMYSFGSFLARYVVEPSAAFGRAPDGTAVDQFGANTFRFFYQLSNSVFGTDYVVADKLKVFVYVPDPVNVYTVLDPYYVDFGYVGVAFFAVITATFCAIVYRRAVAGSPFCQGVYSYLAYIVAFQFFQEELFQSLSVVIQYMFWLAVPFIVGWIAQYRGRNTSSEGDQETPALSGRPVDRSSVVAVASDRRRSDGF